MWIKFEAYVNILVDNTILNCGRLGRIYILVPCKNRLHKIYNINISKFSVYETYKIDDITCIIY